MPDDASRRSEGTAHLRAAAVELIEAARAFLDVAEEVVNDPQSGRDLFEQFGDLATGAVSRLRPDPHASAPAEGDDDDPPTGRVRRIPVS